MARNLWYLNVSIYIVSKGIGGQQVVYQWRTKYCLAWLVSLHLGRQKGSNYAQSHSHNILSVPMDNNFDINVFKEKVFACIM